MRKRDRKKVFLIYFCRRNYRTKLKKWLCYGQVCNLTSQIITLSQKFFCKWVGKSFCAPRILARFGSEIGQNICFAFWLVCDQNSVGNMYGNAMQFLEKTLALEFRLKIFQWNTLFIPHSTVNYYMNHYNLKITQN